jgi:hypothetical protein
LLRENSERRHLVVAHVAAPRRKIDMYPYLPAESLTSIIQIGFAICSLLAAMFSFLMTRSA